MLVRFRFVSCVVPFVPSWFSAPGAQPPRTVQTRIRLCGAWRTRLLRRTSVRGSFTPAAGPVSAAWRRPTSGTRPAIGAGRRASRPARSCRRPAPTTGRSPSQWMVFPSASGSISRLTSATADRSGSPAWRSRGSTASSSTGVVGNFDRRRATTAATPSAVCCGVWPTLPRLFVPISRTVNFGASPSTAPWSSRQRTWAVSSPPMPRLQGNRGACSRSHVARPSASQPSVIESPTNSRSTRAGRAATSCSWRTIQSARGNHGWSCGAGVVAASDMGDPLPFAPGFARVPRPPRHPGRARG